MSNVKHASANSWEHRHVRTLTLCGVPMGAHVNDHESSLTRTVPHCARTRCTGTNVQSGCMAVVKTWGGAQSQRETDPNL